MMPMIRTVALLRGSAGPVLALGMVLAMPATVRAQDAAKPKPVQTAQAQPAPARPAAPATQPRPATPARPATAPATDRPAAPAAAAARPSADGRPVELAKFNDWGAYASDTAKGKVCYVLAQPRERLPKTLTRDPGYLFVSTRPAEGVRNEVSVVLGFPAKDDSEGTATIGTATFALVAKGAAAWLKNAAEDAAFVEALRRGQSLTVKAISRRGNESTDRYVMAGFAQALDRVRKECP
jgi:pyruvate/2-oxoglutarate dehydrogenase complex dihydrolipoamide acyltransferase (E2) component